MVDPGPAAQFDRLGERKPVVALRHVHHEAGVRALGDGEVGQVDVLALQREVRDGSAFARVPDA